MNEIERVLREFGATRLDIWAMQTGAPYPTEYCGGPRDGERAMIDPAMNALGRYCINSDGDAWYRWDGARGVFVWHVEPEEKP